MADVNLQFQKDNVIVTDKKSATYSCKKTVGEKTCTIFVNDRTKNGFGKDDLFYYDGDISLFSQKEIKDLVEKGVGDKKYDEKNVGKGVNNVNVKNFVKMDVCKDLEQGKYYELGSVFTCATTGAEAEAKTEAEAKAKADAEAAAKAKAEADAKAAEAAKTAPPATPAATEKPAAPAKNEAPIPPPPVQNDDPGYYQQQWSQPVSYGPSPAEMMGTSALAGGAIGGIIGFLFGGTRGAFGGALGGALGGLMSFCGGGMGVFGGGMMGGVDQTDMALNMAFANFLNNVSAPRQYVLPPLESPSQPAAPASNLPELTDKNFDETIKKSDKPVVVEFVMDGCAPCKEQGPILEEIAKNNSDKMQVYQVDAVKSDAIKTKYNVEKTPTILVFKDGKVVETIVGFKSKDELTAVLNKYQSPATTEKK